MSVMVDIRSVHRNFGPLELDVIRDLADQGATMIVVTHETWFAREVADTVVFMDDVRTVEQGPPADVPDNPRHERPRTDLPKVL